MPFLRVGVTDSDRGKTPVGFQKGTPLGTYCPKWEVEASRCSIAGVRAHGGAGPAANYREIVHAPAGGRWCPFNDVHTSNPGPGQLEFHPARPPLALRHYTAADGTALHCTALHCTASALHCTALHSGWHPYTQSQWQSAAPGPPRLLTGRISLLEHSAALRGRCRQPQPG